MIREVTGSILCTLKGATISAFYVLSSLLFTVILHSALYSLLSEETVVKQTKN